MTWRLVAEVVLTFMFLIIILGSTDKRAPQGFAPIAIGLGLTLIHLIGIPVTNLSVNPARSTGPALFVGGWALAQLWAFWLAPILGAALAGSVLAVCSCTVRLHMPPRAAPSVGSGRTPRPGSTHSPAVPSTGIAAQSSQSP